MTKLRARQYLIAGLATISCAAFSAEIATPRIDIPNGCESKLVHIAAVSANNVIGINNDLPWSIPEDMQFFLDTTEGKTILMGRKTFESGGHPLPNRLSVVVTQNKDYQAPAPNVIIQHDLESAIQFCRSQANQFREEIFIIGGGEIYAASLQMVDKIYLTRIHREFAGDVKYPILDPNEFELIERRDRAGEPPFSYLTYVRRQK